MNEQEAKVIVHDGALILTVYLFKLPGSGRC